MICLKVYDKTTLSFTCWIWGFLGCWGLYLGLFLWLLGFLFVCLFFFVCLYFFFFFNFWKGHFLKCDHASQKVHCILCVLPISSSVERIVEDDIMFQITLGLLEIKCKSRNCMISHFGHQNPEIFTETWQPFIRSGNYAHNYLTSLHRYMALNIFVITLILPLSEKVLFSFLCSLHSASNRGSNLRHRWAI